MAFNIKNFLLVEVLNDLITAMSSQQLDFEELCMHHLEERSFELSSPFINLCLKQNMSHYGLESEGHQSVFLVILSKKPRMAIELN